MVLFGIMTIDRDDPGLSPGSTALTFRSGAGTQDANLLIPLDVAYGPSAQAYQLAPRLKQSPYCEAAVTARKRHSERARNTPPINATTANRGQTMEKPAPR